MSSPPASVYVRPMAKDDLERVLEIAAGVPSAPDWPRSIWTETLNPRASLSRIVLVAVPSPAAPVDSAVPAVLGFAVASLLPPRAELETIAVDANRQRQGWGRQLLLALVDELKTAGADELLLEVRASNLPAIGLYLSLGFERSGIRSAYYSGPVEDAVLMSLQLK